LGEANAALFADRAGDLVAKHHCQLAKTNGSVIEQKLLVAQEAPVEVFKGGATVGFTGVGEEFE
jgi:hypothetical protein